ncbi:MAG: ABC transporter permease [Lachnospiraceae bacterium]|nr:ABC transporter permease [Lachnospiraceae bacterium]
MWRKFLRRSYIIGILHNAVKFVLSVFALSVLVFAISRLAPGDPLYAYYGERVEKMSAAQQEEAMERLGLREPISAQYARWLQGAVHGDFGISYQYKRDVKEVIAARIGNTLLLGGLGFLLIFALALLLGLFCAWREDRAADRLICKIGTVTSCIPEFWLSLLLILVFAVWLDWLPSSGAYSVGEEGNVADRAAHLILPLAVVVLGHLWYYAFQVRNRLLEEVRADYVLLARMKGLSGRQVLYRHCLRGALPSYLSMMAVALPHILGGTYVVEAVFSYPGIGTLAYESARYQDYNLLMVVSLLTGALVIFCNMLARTVSGRIDPRMRMRFTGGGGEVGGL